MLQFFVAWGTFFMNFHSLFSEYRLVDLVVKASASRVEDPGFAGIFPGSGHTNDLKIGTPVATL